MHESNWDVNLGRNFKPGLIRSATTYWRISSTNYTHHTALVFNSHVEFTQADGCVPSWNRGCEPSLRIQTERDRKRRDESGSSDGNARPKAERRLDAWRRTPRTAFGLVRFGEKRGVQFTVYLKPNGLTRSRHRGNTYLTSLPLVSVRCHGRVTRWKSRWNFTSSASSIFLAHNLCCDNCIQWT